MSNINLDPEFLKSIVAEALLKSLDEKKREALIQSGTRKMQTPQIKQVMVSPIKIHFTFPPWAERAEPLVIHEMDGLEISELHSDQPLPNEPFEFEMVNGRAENYPYLKIRCISETIVSLKESLWLKKSIHIPML